MNSCHLKQLFILLFTLLTFCATADLMLPPFFCYEPENTVTGDCGRIRILGPLLEIKNQQKENSQINISPIMSLKQAEQKLGLDILWPFFMIRDEGNARIVWAFPFFHHSTDVSNTHDNYFAPLVFAGKRPDGTPSWFVFPFAGDVTDFMGLGQVRFLLFPLYCNSKRYGMESHSILWPLIGWATGKSEEKFRLFPFYMRRELKGVRVNESYLWPLLSTARSLQKNRQGYSFFSFPLGGYEKWGSLTNRSFLWPFFTWKTNADSSFVINAPWPFFRYGQGIKNESVLFFWPFWGRSVSEQTEFSFYLWPFIIRLATKSGQHRENWNCILPLYWHQEKWKGDNPQPISNRHHVWPLFSVEQNQDSQKIESLSLIPFNKIGAAYRLYSPLFRFFSLQKNRDGFYLDLLWGFFSLTDTEIISKWNIGPLFSREADSSRAKVEYDFFFGLFKFRKTADKNSCKLLYCIEFTY
ncbi:MAG: hypothetical protein J6W81_10325 [Lentisphaeria bacterium]|nr:hypothetical protein [Lentisphaeria bacterium]